MNFVNKLNLVLLSVLIAGISLSLSIKIFDTTGIYIGIIIPLLISGILIYKKVENPNLQFFAKSLLIITLLATVGAIFGFSYIKKILSGF